MAFTYNNYNESDAVKKKRQELEANATYNPSQSVLDYKTQMDNHAANKVSDWTGGSYGVSLQNALDKITNRQKFTYDLNGDALYQQYKDQYITGGKMAMMDTLGQSAALTGGYGNSYGVTAGNQAYQAYLQRLNDKVPELYQLARDAYDKDGQDLYNQYALYNDAYNNEYGRYRDTVSDWRAEQDRLANQYNNERNFDYSSFTDNRNYLSNAYNNERNFDYSLYSDDYNRAFANYQQGVSESQYAQNLALQKAQHEADLAYKYAALNKQAADKNVVNNTYKYSGSGTVSGTVPEGLNNANTNDWNATDWELYKGMQTQNLSAGSGGITREEAQTMSASDWNRYFKTIQKEYGADAAKEEMLNLVASGVIDRDKLTSVGLKSINL